MELTVGEVQLIMEALIMAKYQTGDIQYQNVLDKILKMKAEQKKEKRKKVF